MKCFNSIIILIQVLLIESCRYAIKEAPVQLMFNTSYWQRWNNTLTKSSNGWKTENRAITYNDKEFRIKGSNFNGFESDCRVPLGLQDRPLSFFLDFLHSEKFNAIRVPLPFEIMNNLDLQINYCVQAEPNLHPGQSVLTAIQYVLDEAWKRGIFVLFDLHTIDNVITELPWTDSVNENMVVDAWLNFLKNVYKHPALMGIEIKNEPHGSISLEVFLNHCAKVITNIEHYLPEYNGLYFISGIQNGGPWGGAFTPEGLEQGFTGLTYPSIMATTKTPTDRFVLNPHVYGPSVRGNNIMYEGPEQWEQQYGFVTELKNHWNMSAIIPTEFGGRFTENDKEYYYKWLDWHKNKKGLHSGGFWWTLTHFSSDTGGLLDDNYQPIPEKLEFMTQFITDPTIVRRYYNLRGTYNY